ncbi:MAG: AAA family ATPase [Woeseiaceae bacterium]|nr:AAA family ATPase [Woeseiaceae bacterium]
MYTSFFGLNEKPFSITPDPRYLFMSERHGEALAHLVYGVTESGGFMQLTGEVGTGKTTLVRTLLLNRMPANADVAVVLNPQLSALEFVQTICEELHVTMPEDRNSIKALIDALNEHLLKAHAEGRRTILVVDEAQNLAPDVLEQVRLLTNLETSKQKLLQIILIGQPELRQLLARNDLRQLAQRITGRYHLEPLSRDETAQYVEHRLKVAGAVGEVFDPGAKREVFRYSEGVPRLINVICDRALLGAYSGEERRISRRLIREAADEVAGQTKKTSWTQWAFTAIGITAVAVLGASYLAMLEERNIPAAEVPAVETVVAETAEAAPVEAPAEPEASLDEELQLARELTGDSAAFATLMDLWAVDFTNCAGAEAAGYRCLRQRGTWGNLRQYNLPAILTLVDQRGNSHEVVLTSIDGQRAGLSIGGVGVEHGIDEVSNLWLGQYMLLWRPPNGVAISLGPGSTGENVVWLRNSLVAVDPRYRSENPDSDVYDADLEQQVRAFQRDNRLDVDGLAGQQTQIIINSLLATDDSPRLVTALLAQE